tara:strand:+ start:268 stop:1344 length:1077 start_codon:yes stop_codon:yes gene_type:complete
VTSDKPTPHIEPDHEAVEKLSVASEQISRELGRVIVGQASVVEDLLLAMLAGGHALLVGVPGLAKTLMVRTLADTLGLSFSRIQFTPDLMPADITGTEVIQEDRGTGNRDFRFLAGPVFANVVLADEINRTPPKTQAALLEAMEEHQVTAGGRRHPLAEPFFVLATQNPIEQEGTYTLPEAQLDRFMFQVMVDYPGEDEEFEIIRRTTSDATPRATTVLDHEDVVALQQLVRQIPVADHVVRYAINLCRLSRPTRNASGSSEDFVDRYVQWGAGPRAGQSLVLGAKARAVLGGRSFVSIEDIRAVVYPVLRHRIITSFEAEADRVVPDDVVDWLLNQTPAETPIDNPAVAQIFRSNDQ